MKHLFLLFLVSFSLHTSAQEADFYKEELQFSVDSLWFRMQGDFYVARYSSATQAMRLAFPVPQGTMPLIDSFKVYDYRTQKTVAFQRGASEFIFTVPFANADSIVLNIQYRQLIKDSSLSYIITTVQEWHRPLKYASYSLQVPDYCAVSCFSLSVDKSIHIQDKTIYLWQRSSFMPHDDFRFYYKRK